MSIALALALALLLTAMPALAQTHIYTNADLGGPLVATRPDPAAAAAILAPYQMVFTAPLPYGPSVVGVWSSPTAGPYGDFRRFSPARRLDGTSLFQPAWQMTTYIGRSSPRRSASYFLHPRARIESSAMRPFSQERPPSPKGETTGKWTRTAR